MKAGQLFPIVDHVPVKEIERLGGKHIHLATSGRAVGSIKAESTGEFRSPKAGEWFLSGAIVEAYRAHSNLSMPYRIARLVRVEMVTTETVVQR